MLFTFASLLPVALGAALVPRQSSDSNAYIWSAPGITYDGQTILGSFNNVSNSDSSLPGITTTNFDSATPTSLNVTVQNLMPSLGKPLSDQLSSFVSDGSNDFGSLDTTYVYGIRALDVSIGPGQYLNFSLPLNLPTKANDAVDDDDDDNDNDRLADALDNSDAKLTHIAKIGVDKTFVALNTMDVGDRKESGTASLYSSEGEFVSLSRGYVNSSSALPTTRAAYILTYAAS